MTLTPKQRERMEKFIEAQKLEAYKCCETCGINFSNAECYVERTWEAALAEKDELLAEAVKGLEFYSGDNVAVTEIKKEAILESNFLKTDSSFTTYRTIDRGELARATLERIKN